jgi:hypothetical protein
MVATTFQDDLVILPKELARNLSNISRLVLAKRIGSGIHVIDPLTGEVRNCCVYLYCCRRATMSEAFCALPAAAISVRSLTFLYDVHSIARSARTSSGATPSRPS